MLLNVVARHQTVTLNLLLFGDGTLPRRDMNLFIFNKVQRYIIHTKRFA